jgi:hypothetical protein
MMSMVYHRLTKTQGEQRWLHGASLQNKTRATGLSHRQAEPPAQVNDAIGSGEPELILFTFRSPRQAISKVINLSLMTF